MRYLFKPSGLALLVALALSTLAVVPAGAAATDKLRRSGQIDEPSVALILFQVQGYLNDNRDGQTHGPFKYGGWGTGFFVSSDGFIATAAHVAAPTQETIKNQLVEQYLVSEAKRVGCLSTGNCSQLVDQYRSGYQLASSVTGLKTTLNVFTQEMNPKASETTGLSAEVKQSSPTGQRDIAVIKVNMQNSPVLKIADAGKVRTQDPIAIIGYPGGANLGEGGVTSAESSFVPTITGGSITAKKQGSAAIGIAPGVNIFQTDATIEHGNSGGPAINEDGDVIGLVSFGPTSTTNFLITASDIQDLIRQSGANNSRGAIDQLWRQGLSYMDQRRYGKAKATFEQCAALNKAQVGCAASAREATGLLSQDEEAKYSGGASTPIGALVVGALLIALLVGGAIFLLRRRRPQTLGLSSADPAPQAAAYWQAPPPAPGPPAPAHEMPQLAPPAPGPAAVPSQSNPAPPLGFQRPYPSPQASEPVGQSPDPGPNTGMGEPAAPAQPARFCSNCGSSLEGRPACGRCGFRPA